MSSLEDEIDLSPIDATDANIEELTQHNDVIEEEEDTTAETETETGEPIIEGEEEEEELEVELPEITEEKKIAIQSHNTIYKGRNVRYYEITGQKIDVLPTEIYAPGAISLVTKGYVDSFRVSTNDMEFKVHCQIRDHEGGIRTICNDTGTDLAKDGAGMTYGEVENNVTQSAYDKTGTYDPVNPFLMRAKNAFSGTETDYEHNLGTVNDKYIVINYSPMNQLEFSRLDFHIHNTNPAGTRRIHKYILRYVEFIEEEKPIPEEYVDPEKLGQYDIEVALQDDGSSAGMDNTLTENPVSGEHIIKENKNELDKKDIVVENISGSSDIPINISY